MSQITLADLKRNKDTAVQEGKEETGEKSFSLKERARIEEIKGEIDIRDSQMLMQYGSGAKQNIADFSENILRNIRAKDSGYVGELMEDLIANVEGLDFTVLENQGILKNIFKRAEARVKKFLAQYEKLEVQIDKIEGKLDEARMEMLKDIGMLDAMYEKNLQYFRHLSLYITAGEEKLLELKGETLPALFREVKESGDPMDAQLVRDFQETVDQFEKKVYDLKTSKTIAVQTAPQIRLIQNNDKLLADKIQTAIQETIPLWKSQMVVALGLYRQKEVLKFHRNITDTTNALLLKNSEQLKQNAAQVARESQRGIVDIETLKKANENLIKTMHEAVRIQEEGRKKRAAAEAELEALEKNIRDSLME